MVAEGAEALAQRFFQSGIWSGDTPLHLLSPEPLYLSPDEIKRLESLGEAIYSFYSALNHLYLRKGHEWAAGILDIGKPEWLIEMARMNFQKRHLPRIIRPDLMMAEDAFWITELDSVPGGAGQTALMASWYAGQGFPVIGGGDGIPLNFASVLDELAEKSHWTAVIVVSDEAEDYRTEHNFLASLLRKNGKNVFCLHPREVIFNEEGLWIGTGGQEVGVDVVWRFFELFDLKNIPKHELVAYAAKKKRAVVNPPYKAFLEEKLALALFQHPALQDYWKSEMGDHYGLMKASVPPSWIVDSSTVPPHAEISGLRFRGKPVRSYLELKEASQKERRLVLKPSGFSPHAWGARGVVVGHDVSSEEWGRALEQAVASYRTTPYVLQEFKEGRRLKVQAFHPGTGVTREFNGRARLSPYYYVYGNKARLAGVLATICSPEKKIIHGMTDAVMTVCAEGRSQSVSTG